MSAPEDDGDLGPVLVACPVCLTPLDAADSRELIPQLVCRSCGLSAGVVSAVPGRTHRSA